MSADLANEIEDLLRALEETQLEMAEMYRAKREAIRQGDAPAMNAVAETEGQIVERLDTHLRSRQDLLQRIGKTGAPHDSLEEVVRSIAAPARDRLLAQIERTRSAADANRRESWIVWIVARQSLRLLGEMLDLIAHGGRKAPVYSLRSESEHSFGGSILDASA